MKVLVTGGAGFLGSSICDRLFKDGIEPIIVDNLSRGSEENVRGMRLYKNDLTNMNQEVFKILKYDKPEYIYHFAAINGTNNFYEKPKEVFNQNIDITYNLIATLKMVMKQDKDYKPKIIYASTSEVYGDPECIPTPETSKSYARLTEDRDSYSMSKFTCEFYIKYFCKENNLDYLITRIFNVFGKRDHSGHVVPDIIKKIKESDKIEVYGTGNETRSFCYVEDFVNMLMKLVASDKWNDVYNIGKSEEISIRYLITTIEKVMNKTVVRIGTRLRDGDHTRRCPDISKLLSVIGEYAFLSLEEGLRRII